MKSRPFLCILLLTVTFFPPIRGYILGPGCAAYENDIFVAIREIWGSTVCAKSTLNLQDNRVEDWFGLLESLFPGLNYSDPHTLAQWRQDPNYDIGPETISATETLQSKSWSRSQESFGPLILFQYLFRALNAVDSFVLTM